MKWFCVTATATTVVVWDYMRSTVVRRFRNIFVTICASLLLDAIRLEYWQPRHSAGTAKRQPGLERGWAHLSRAWEWSLLGGQRSVNRATRENEFMCRSNRITCTASNSPSKSIEPHLSSVYAYLVLRCEIWDFPDRFQMLLVVLPCDHHQPNVSRLFCKLSELYVWEKQLRRIHSFW